MQRKYFFIFLLSFCTQAVWAQRYVYQKITLKKDGVSGSIGYLGAGVRYHQFYHKDAISAFADFGWNITDKWIIGASANVMTSTIKLPYNPFEPVALNQKWENRFGLMKVAFIPTTYKLTHLVLGLGFGGSEIKAKIEDPYTYQFYNASYTYVALIEPFIEYELNVSKRFRPCIGFSYLKAVYQTNKASLIPSGQISSPSFYIAARFGEF